MDEIGIVVKIVNDEATVEFERKTACKNCGMCFATANDRKVALTLKNEVNAKEGDTVRVSSDTGNVLSSILIVYAVPLLMFFIGLIAAHLLFDNELVSFFAGFGFLVLGYLVLNRLDKKIGKAKQGSLLPKIVSIESPQEDENKKEEYIADLEKEIID